MSYDDWVELQERNRKAAYEQAKANRKFVRQVERERLAFVYCVLPRCDQCGGTEHRLYRSAAQGDGSRLKWAQCQTCGHKFIQVWE